MLTAAHLLNGLLMIGAAVALAVWLRRFTHQPWPLYLAGVVTFIGSQVFHIPFNLAVLNPILGTLGFPGDRFGTPLVLGALLLGLSAGVFEETARYLVLRFWKRDARSWSAALMYGGGHGGAEAIILGLLVLVTLFQMTAYRTLDLSTIVPPEQLELAQAQVEAYWSVPWPQALLGAVERVFAMALHLSLAVMVMRVFTHGKLWWLAAAIGWHAAVNAVAVVAVNLVGPVQTELIVAVFGALSVAIVYALREPDPEPGAPPVSGAASARGAAGGADLERIDDARYTG